MSLRNSAAVGFDGLGEEGPEQEARISGNHTPYVLWFAELSERRLLHEVGTYHRGLIIENFFPYPIHLHCSLFLFKFKVSHLRPLSPPPLSKISLQRMVREAIGFKGVYGAVFVAFTIRHPDLCVTFACPWGLFVSIQKALGFP